MGGYLLGRLIWCSSQLIPGEGQESYGTSMANQLWLLNLVICCANDINQRTECFFPKTSAWPFRLAGSAGFAGCGLLWVVDLFRWNTHLLWKIWKINQSPHLTVCFNDYKWHTWIDISGVCFPHICSVSLSPLLICKGASSFLWTLQHRRDERAMSQTRSLAGNVILALILDNRLQFSIGFLNEKLVWKVATDV